jgi:hypothetical protein
MSIQEAVQRRRFSRLRQVLHQLVEELPRLIKPVLADRPVIKGSVYEIKRRCGKPGCKCARGEALHKSMVLSTSEQGRTKLRTIPRGSLTDVRQKVVAYQQIRRFRTQLVKTHQKMLEIIDEIEALRREEMK